MHKQELILQQTAAFIQKDFEVEEIPEDVTEEQILDFLERFVHDLIDNDLNKLFYALYRLDINELKVHRALSPKSVEPPHQAIARLIFEREKQKATTRIEYNSDDEGDGWYN